MAPMPPSDLETVGLPSARAKLRVLFVSPVSEIKGGAERVLLELLANPWLDPVLAVPEPGELSAAAEQRNIPFACFRPTALLGVHRPPRLTKLVAAAADAVRCAVRIRRIARQHDCALIHTNGLKAHAVGGITRAMFGSKVLMHLHDIPYSRTERLIWRLIGALASRIIIVSRPCWPGKVGGKAVVVPNTVRPVKPALDAATLPATLRLGFVGRYHPHKCLDLFLDWVIAARDSGLDVKAVLRGGPDAAQPEYWPGIEARIRNEGLENWVTNQGWRAHGTVYEDLDFLLLPSAIPDPAPLVIPEAMTAGIVVIGYPAGGIPDLMPPGTGTLARTPAELAAALRAYVDSPELYRQTRIAAYRQARAVHDADAVARRFAAVCASVVGRPVAPETPPEPAPQPALETTLETTLETSLATPR